VVARWPISPATRQLLFTEEDDDDEMFLQDDDDEMFLQDDDA
jgi:hypothetical protein